MPCGTYQEFNPYILLQTAATSDLPEEPQPETINYLDWSLAGLQSQDLLRVKLVEVENFNTLYLHPDDSSCQYLGWLRANRSRSVKCSLCSLLQPMSSLSTRKPSWSYRGNARLNLRSSSQGKVLLSNLLF